MKKKTAAKARKKKAPPVPVPSQLAGLLAIVQEQGEAYADDMSRALVVARKTLRDPIRSDWYGTQDAAWSYIGNEAARGPWKGLHAAIDKLTRPEDSTFNATTGDFHNVYGLPALLMGMALAYVHFVEGGQR